VAKTKMNVGQLMDHVNKIYGEGTLMTASKAKSLVVRRLSTGILALDLETGGGWPEGRISVIHGPESSGKSTLTYLGGKQFLLKYPDSFVLIVDTEYSVTPQYLELLGYTPKDLDQTLIMFPDSGEQAGDVACEVLANSEHCLVILDSVAAMIPSKEIEDSMDKSHPGSQARLMNQFFRKLLPVMKKELMRDDPAITVLLINQNREKIGVMFGDPTTQPGGKGQKYHSSMTISTRRKGWIEEGKGAKKERIGMVLAFTVEKNKVGGRQKAHGDFPYLYDTAEIANEGALRLHGVLNEIVSKKGSWFTYRKLKAGSKDAFDALLKKNPRTAARLRREILKAEGVRTDEPAKKAPRKKRAVKKTGKKARSRRRRKGNA
jgi:recombination protein RecA